MQYAKPKTNFIIVSFKKNILPLIFCIFTFCLVIFSKENLVSAKEGLTLWANCVVPSLFPFFIATELLSHTNIIDYLGKWLNSIMRPIFNVPGSGSFAFIMGIISGYPIGAKIVTKLRFENKCTKPEAERLIAFTNNSGPLFIIGTVGILLFGDATIGILLFITHLLACISVGFIFRFWKKNKIINHTSEDTYSITEKDTKFSNLGGILSDSIISSVNTIVMIGGFVVLFSVIISILNQSRFLMLLSNMINPALNILNITDKFTTPFISGLIELTNGVKLICAVPYKAISVNIIISAFLLGFGGLSVLLQVFSIVSKTDISIKSYIYGKLLHGLLAAFYTFVALKYFTFLNLDISPVFSNSSTGLNVYKYNYFILLTVLFVIIAIFCFYNFKKIRK